MKCDELKNYDIMDIEAMDDERLEKSESGKIQVTRVYIKSEVDDAITELKEKMESVQASAYAESVDAGMENRKLKRAMWLARAERAHVTTLYWNVYCYQNNCLYFRDFMPENCNPFRSLPKKTAMEWSDLWESIETKCRAYAEKYK